MPLTQSCNMNIDRLEPVTPLLTGRIRDDQGQPPVILRFFGSEQFCPKRSDEVDARNEFADKLVVVCEKKI